MQQSNFSHLSVCNALTFESIDLESLFLLAMQTAVLARGILSVCLPVFCPDE